MAARRLISALLIALTISGVFTFWLSRKVSKPHSAAPERTQYVAAATNLEAGDALKPEKLKLIDWPVNAPLQGSYAKPEALAGRVLLYPLAAGEPILERQLSAAGSSAGLTVKIPEGMRAISLKSDEVLGVAGYLLPGTHVDVIVTYRDRLTQTQITQTILQDVEVLTAGQKMQPDPEGKPTAVDVVTLLVNLKDAEEAVMGSSLGTIHFVLRNGTDRKREDRGNDLMHLAASVSGPAHPPITMGNRVPHPPVGIPATSAYKVETTLGNKSSVESF